MEVLSEGIFMEEPVLLNFETTTHCVMLPTPWGMGTTLPHTRGIQNMMYFRWIHPVMRGPEPDDQQLLQQRNNFEIIEKLVKQGWVEDKPSKKIQDLEELIEGLRSIEKMQNILESTESTSATVDHMKMASDLNMILDWMRSRHLNNLMRDEYEAVERCKNDVPGTKQDMRKLAQACEFLKKYALSDYIKELLADKAEKLSRDDILVIFLTAILFVSNFLSMFMSTRFKKRYILLWTDKAVLLVLWTCGDVELNPGPHDTTGNKRSQILRKFRRFSQTMILGLLYKACNREMQGNPYSESPPGWDEYKPQIKFGNISNLKSGEDEVFNKMIYLLKNQKLVPLSSEWEALLCHYTNLYEKSEIEKSKRALENWMCEKKLVPLLKEYSESEVVPSEEILNMSFHMLKKVQLDVLKTKEVDGKDWKTHESEPNGSEQLVAEERREMLSWKIFRKRKGHNSDMRESAKSRTSSDHYTAIRAIELPDHSQRKRKRMETETCQNQETSKENEPLFNNNYGLGTLETTHQKSLRMNLENVDPHMAQCSRVFDKSDRDQTSMSSNESVQHQDAFPSSYSSGEERHDGRSIQECFPDSNGENRDDTFLDSQTYTELTLGLYEPETLLMYLEKYVKDLGSGKPSPVMIKLCKDILNKENSKD